MLALTLIITVTACSGDGGPKSSGQAADPAAVASAVAQVASASPGAAAPALPVLAVRDSTDDEKPVRVQLNDLRVRGKLTHLTFTITHLAAPDAASTADPPTWEPGTFFADHVSQGGSLTDDFRSIDGVYLLDSTNAKRYLAARDAKGGCMCSHYVGLLEAGHSMVLSSVFAALPEGVNAADVVVPHFGTFNDVPVSR